MPLQLHCAVETWPIAGTFAISRGSKREAHVVVAAVSDGRITGRGECVPYARYGETAGSVLETLRSCGSISDRQHLRRTVPPGAARNALDCALWDFEAKASGRAAAGIADCPSLVPLLTCYTLSLAGAAEMAEKARAAHHLPLLKLKLGGGPEDAARLAAVRAARPDARLVVDANEAWSPDDFPSLMRAAQEADVELIEQPLPAGQDAALATLPHAVPLCADESAHTSADVAALRDRYDAVNIKLDKAGGLTEALDMAGAARRCGMKIMIGCMVATSLAMAPALIVAQQADWVDLDGPLLLARDRVPGLRIKDGIITPPGRDLWG